MTIKRFIFLAKLGIIEANDEAGNYQIQKIDNVEEFADEHGLNFIPPSLKDDREALECFRSLTHNQLENL